MVALSSMTFNRGFAWSDVIIMTHGCMMYTERATVAAVSNGTSHVRTKQRCSRTTWVDIQRAL